MWQGVLSLVSRPIKGRFVRVVTRRIVFIVNRSGVVRGYAIRPVLIYILLYFTNFMCFDADS